MNNAVRNPFEFSCPLVGGKKRRSPYVPNKLGVEFALSVIGDKEYVSIVGPPHCGETSLVGEIVDRLSDSSHRYVICLLDFREIQRTTEPEYYQYVADLVKKRSDRSVISRRAPRSGKIRRVSNAYRLGLFLRSVLAEESSVFIFVVDHLEALQEQIAKSILRCSRTLHDQREIYPEFARVVLVSCGSLSLHRLTAAGESPFNMSRIFAVEDLEEGEASELIQQGFELAGVKFSEKAVGRIVDTTEGDRYMIQRICHDSVEKIGKDGHRTITLGLVKETTREFISLPKNDKCMSGAFERIQSDQVVEKTVFDVIDKNHIKVRDLNTIIDIGDCELTGAVKIGRGRYVPRNEIYKKCVDGDLRPLYEGRKEIKKYLARCKATFGDIRDRQINMMQVIGITERIAEKYHTDEYLSDTLSLISDSIHYTKSENMSGDQVDCLGDIYRNNLKVGVGKDAAKRSLRVLREHHFIVAPRVLRISTLYEEMATE